MPETASNRLAFQCHAAQSAIFSPKPGEKFSISRPYDADRDRQKNRQILRLIYAKLIIKVRFFGKSTSARAS